MKIYNFFNDNFFTCCWREVYHNFLYFLKTMKLNKNNFYTLLIYSIFEITQIIFHQITQSCSILDPH